MQPGTRDCGLDRTALGHLVHEVHSREKEQLSRPIEPSRSGSSHQVVTSFPGIRYSHEVFGPSYHRLVCYQNKREALSLCVCGSGSHGEEARCFSISLEQSQCLNISPFHSSEQVLSKMMLPCSWWLFSGFRSGLQIYWLFLWKSLCSFPCCEIFWSICT